MNYVKKLLIEKEIKRRIKASEKVKTLIRALLLLILDLLAKS